MSKLYVYGRLLTYLMVNHRDAVKKIFSAFFEEKYNRGKDIYFRGKDRCETEFKWMYEFIAKMTGGCEILANFAKNMQKIPIFCELGDMKISDFLDKYDVNALILHDGDEFPEIMNILGYLMKRDDNRLDYLKARQLVSQGINVQHTIYEIDDDFGRIKWSESKSALLLNQPPQWLCQWTSINSYRFYVEPASLHLSGNLMFIEAGVYDPRCINVFNVSIKNRRIYIEYTRALAMYIEMMM